MAEKSPMEIGLERKILRFLRGHEEPTIIAKMIFADPELQELQDYANIVAIRRLGYNDHGPVHMRKVTLNALQMLSLLHEAGVPTSLEADHAGTYEESLSAVLLAGMMHDLGMCIGRQDHERHSMMLAAPLIVHALAAAFPDPEDVARRAIVKAVAFEGIIGHMAVTRIHSLEAGTILIGDGCDMTKGRARIALIENGRPPQVGDIHKYSAHSIEKVTIARGEVKPIRIDVEMTGDVGFFQIEEVLMTKVNMSPVKPYIELFAGVKGAPRKQYL